MELNTAVKPYYIEFLLSRDNPDVVLYFDPDIEIYGSCQGILDELGEGTVLLTPHTMSPLPDDDLEIPEAAFLNFGVYNLGFIGVSDGPERPAFLDWWKARTGRWGYMRPARGLFADQLWVNLAPLFFEQVRASRLPGFNMAYWNLHERTLSAGEDGALMVNGACPLVFFHFSAFDPMSPESIAKYQNRFSLASRPDLDRLFRQYAERLLANGYERFMGLECDFVARRQAHLRDVRKRYAAEHLRREPVRYVVTWSALQGLRACRKGLSLLDAPLRRRLPGPDEDLGS